MITLGINQHSWLENGRFLKMYFNVFPIKNGGCHSSQLSGQIIATNPPRSPQMVVKSKGIPPKSPENSGVGISS